MSESIDPRSFDAAVFDLDGVITDTASVHLGAWTQLFNGFLDERATAGTSGPEEDLSAFTDEDYRRDVDGKPRLDGIRSFLATRGVEVDDDTVRELAERKNHAFVERLDEDGVTVFDSTVRLIHRLHLAGIRTAIFSASRNAGPVLERAGLSELFEARVDGRTADDLDLAGKPDPAVPLEAARRVGADAARTILVEDARSGVEAGRRGGFGHVIGIDRHDNPEELRRHGADVVVSDLDEVRLEVQDRALSEVPDATPRWDALVGLLRGLRPVVFLDFDGTLAPIVEEPDDAALPPATQEAVERLASRCTVAVVSGRDLRDVRARVDIPGLWVAGSHGFELVGPDGEHHEQPRADEALPALDDAEARLSEELADAAGIQVERKRFAIAVHTRRAASDVAERAEQAVEAVATEGAGLRVTGGRAIRELRPDIDWDKGTALRWVLEQLPSDGDARARVAVYAGDDLTDEDALREVQADGVGIVVANDEHGDRTTFAHAQVDSTDAMCALLERLAELLEE